MKKDFEPLKKIVVEPETLGFHARGNEKPPPFDLEDFLADKPMGEDSREVEIIRGLTLFEHDGFIKLM